MSKKIEEFRSFVSKYPNIRNDVLNGKRTWQNIYEDWVLFGEDSDIWNKYSNRTESSNNTETKNSFDNATINEIKNMKLEDLLSGDNLKNIWGYIKKINPDNLSKTLNTVQKVLQITQSFGSKPTGLYNANYNSWWD